MNRRSFVISSASFTGGLSVLLGTGAFSASEISRNTNISIVNDANALIGLVPNPDVSGVDDDSGQLTIDLDDPGVDDSGQLTIDLDDPGVNQNSIYQFGSFVSDSDINGQSNLGDFPYSEESPSKVGGDGFGSAFLIANQTDNKQTLELDYELTVEDDDGGDGYETSVWFEVHRGNSRMALLEPTEDTDVDDTATVTLNSGENIGVSFLLEVPGDTVGEKIGGSLTVTAGEAIEE